VKVAPTYLPIPLAPSTLDAAEVLASARGVPVRDLLAELLRAAVPNAVNKARQKGELAPAAQPAPQRVPAEAPHQHPQARSSRASAPPPAPPAPARRQRPRAVEITVRRGPVMHARGRG
jgi:hypothetical protein